METKVESQVNFDISDYVLNLAKLFNRRTAGSARRFSRDKVRVDTSALRNSIRIEIENDRVTVVLTDLPYSLAQEYGRPDLPNYGFTPYMRPGAKQATSASEISRNVDGLETEALKAI